MRPRPRLALADVEDQCLIPASADVVDGAIVALLAAQQDQLSGPATAFIRLESGSER
jgi:hypothetical protein